MKWLSLFSLVALAGVACVGEEADPEAGVPAEQFQTPVAPAPDTAAPAAPEPVQEQAAPRATPAQTSPLVDEPWTPTFTGTVQPGMTRDQVVETWGEPVAERMAGSFAYLYFRNGCEVSCGTFDVVFLENGQVIDAIVRHPGHTYAGVSSSPADRQAQFTPPGSVPGTDGPR